MLLVSALCYFTCKVHILKCPYLTIPLVEQRHETKDGVILVETFFNPVILSLHAKINALVLLKSIYLHIQDICLEPYLED